MREAGDAALSRQSQPFQGEADDPLVIEAEVAVHAGIGLCYSGQPFGHQLVLGVAVHQPLLNYLELGVLLLGGEDILCCLHLQTGHHELCLRVRCRADSVDEVMWVAETSPP